MRASLGIASLLLFTAVPAFAATDIPAQSFDAISISGGGHIILKYGPSPRVTLIKGSTDVTSFKFKRAGSLEIEACNRCPQHYDLEIEAVTPNITAIAVRGGGKIDSATGFPSQSEISIAVSGGGEIVYLGDPEIAQAVHGGGAIRPGG